MYKKKVLILLKSFSLCYFSFSSKRLKLRLGFCKSPFSNPKQSVC